MYIVHFVNSASSMSIVRTQCVYCVLIVHRASSMYKTVCPQCVYCAFDVYIVSSLCIILPQCYSVNSSSSMCILRPKCVYWVLIVHSVFSSVSSVNSASSM